MIRPREIGDLRGNGWFREIVRSSHLKDPVEHDLLDLNGNMRGDDRLGGFNARFGAVPRSTREKRTDRRRCKHVRPFRGRRQIMGATAGRRRHRGSQWSSGFEPMIWRKIRSGFAPGPKQQNKTGHGKRRWISGNGGRGGSLGDKPSPVSSIDFSR